MRRRRNERGFAMVWVVIVIAFLLVVGGLAVDWAYHLNTRNQLQSTLDAAALAGAGKLGFGPEYPATARTFARVFAEKNPLRLETAMTLAENPTNNPNLFASASAPYGDVLLGVWDPSKPDGIGVGMRFEPTNDHTRITAVMCRYKAQVPTALFRLWGINVIPVSAMAVAIGNPIDQPDPTEPACTFPVAASSCFFEGNTTNGCGATITFITSSDQSQLGVNSAAWTSLSTSDPANVPNVKAAIEAAASGQCAQYDVGTGDEIRMSGGEMQTVISNTIKPAFQQIFNAPDAPIHTVYGPDGEDGPPQYVGKGWEVIVPVFHTAECPMGSQTPSSAPIQTWARMVITQVLDVGGECAVANHWKNGDNPWDQRCLSAKNGLNATGADPYFPANRGIFGYFDCETIKGDPTPLPVPIPSRPERLMLVK